jgi:hypothetical protein
LSTSSAAWRKPGLRTCIGADAVGFGFDYLTNPKPKSLKQRPLTCAWQNKHSFNGSGFGPDPGQGDFLLLQASRISLPLARHGGPLDSPAQGSEDRYRD